MMNGDMQNGINQILSKIGDRPSMFVPTSTNTFETFVAYFQGIFTGIKISKNINLERTISAWYQDKVENKAPNMNWFSHFELINKDKSDQEKVEILIENLKTFFSEVNSATFTTSSL